MKCMFLQFFVLSLSISSLGFAMSPEDHKTAIAMIDVAYSPDAPPAVLSRAGYFIFKNNSHAAVTIEGASSEYFSRVELHKTTLKSGIASMLTIDAITVKPGEVIHFKPGGMHLMLMGLKGKNLSVGDTIPVELRFRQRLPVRFDLVIKKQTMMKGKEKEGDMTDHSTHDMHKHH